jgi:selenocysteine lyase/cysteine desulfurase
MPGWQVLTPEAPAPSGLVAFRAEGSDGSEGPELVARLSAEGITLRHVPDTDAVRISCGFFNTHEEVDRALALIGPPKAS